MRIVHRDLPVDLRDAAGELRRHYGRATASAQAGLDALRATMEAQRAEAEARVAAVRPELKRTETALDQRMAALHAAQVGVRELAKAHAEGHAARQALDVEIARFRYEALARERKLNTVRPGFLQELKNLREIAERAEERLRTTESARYSKSTESVAPSRSCRRNSRSGEARRPARSRPSPCGRNAAGAAR